MFKKSIYLFVSLAFFISPIWAATEIFKEDPLIVAVYENRPDDVRDLLVRRASTSRTDDDGKTALIWGCIQGS